MKDFSKIILAAGAFLLLGMPAPAKADTPPAAAPVVAAAPALGPSSYAFVNLNRVMHDCGAGQTIRTDIDAKLQQFQTELTRENQALSAARQDFEKARKDMAPADADKKMHELEAKYAAADKTLQERRHLLNKAGGSAFGELKKDAIEIILDLSKQRNYAAVFSQESVILAAQEFDITDEVIKRLNQTVKKINVDWTQDAQKPAPAKK